MKNRMFIFGDYQGTRIASSGGAVQNLGYGGFYTIPTPAMAHGDFSSLLRTRRSGPTPWAARSIKGQIYDPASTTDGQWPVVRDAVPGQHHSGRTGSIRPRPRLHVAFPAPNQPSHRQVPAEQLLHRHTRQSSTDQGDGRVDYRLSEKDSLFGSLSWSKSASSTRRPYPGALDGATSTASPKRIWAATPR